MVGPEDAIYYAMGYEDTEDMTEGQLANYMLEQGLFDDFDDCDCDDE